MAEEVAVVAVMKLKPEEEQRGLEILRGVIEATHDEDGCARYTLHRASGEPGTYCIVEKWRSQADLDAHFGRPHMAPLAEAVQLLAEPPQIYFCEPVEVGISPKGAL